MRDDWRFLRGSRVSVAHLWQESRSASWHKPWYKSQCNRLAVDDVFRETYPLAGEASLIRKCRKCVAFETRRKEQS